MTAAYYSELPYGGDGLMNAPSPWSGHYDVDQVIWATAHHTQFTESGWRYLRHGNGVGQLQNGGTYVSLTDPTSRELTIIVESMSRDVSGCVHEDAPPGNVTTQQVTFTLGGSFTNIKQLNVFFSTFHRQAQPTWFQYVKTMTIVNNQFTITLNPDELYTFSTVNGTKGSFAQAPPVNTPFPSTYADDFDDYRLSSEAKYFTDQSGSFEIVKATDSERGNVMRQMVPAAPVPWCGDASYPYSLMGNHQWSKINVSVDVFIESVGTAYIAAQVRSGGCVGHGGTGAIAFAVRTDNGGGWILSDTTGFAKTILSGNYAISANTWYHLDLHVLDAATEVYINGKLVGTTDVVSSKSGNGWIAIGSSFNYAQFDRIRVQASTPSSEQNLPLDFLIASQ